MLLTPVVAAAADLPQVLIGGIEGCDFATGRITAGCIPRFIGHLIELVFGLVSLFFILNVMYAGYQIAFGYIQGEKAKGMTRLRWSIIGLVVCVSAFLILDVILTVILG